MLPPVFQTLKASNAVKAIVGTNPPRIWFEEAPEDWPRPILDPYVTWLLVSSVPENNLSDPPPVDRQTVQVDCWHLTQKGIDLLADACRDAVEPVAHMTNVFGGREPATKLYRMSLQFDFRGR